MEVDPDLPVVNADRQRLIQVLQNLVENAVKFLGDGPERRVEIGVGPASETEHTIYVRDTGVGIDPRYQEQVFGLFNRLDPDLEGTGVGLTIVQRLVELQGGRVWAESAGLGCGTTFYFTLPKRRTDRG